MKKKMLLLLTLALIAGVFGGCGRGKQTIYEQTYLTLFDTVTTVRGTAESREVFDESARAIHDELLQYHQLFDIYNGYEGMNNLKTVNDRAGEPVEVDRKIIDLLLDCRDYYELTGGRVNVALGSVLSLWHDARNAGLEDPANARLPDRDALEQAAAHTSLELLVIDEAASTVCLTDPRARLDVGAVAKGWAAQQVAEKAPAGMLISVGGNVCATGPKDEAGTPWVIGIQDPDSSGFLHTLNVTGGSVVTSGDYQRTYTVDGKMYHHIIDPDTLYPGAFWRSVTIVCEDSGLADALSTALFLMSRAEGETLLETCGADAMWVDVEGNTFRTAGFETMLRS